MSFTSPFKKLFFWFVVFIVLIEILVRVFPVYYFEKPEKFLITYIREKIERGKNEYDIIILGDSRSMSFNPSNFRNIYNFSLPAMGTRYYKYFMKKYLHYNKKPKAVIFAGSPTLVHSGKGNPLVDQRLVNFVYPDMPLKEYIYVRTIKRVLNLKQEFMSPQPKYNEEFWWEFFSHRFLFLFSTWEISEIYRGPEWFFIVSQSIPLNYHTFKYRDAILNLFKLETYLFQKNEYGTPNCSCNRIYETECQPPKSGLQDNLIMKRNIEKHHGFYNISDRISKDKILQWQAQVQIMKERQINVANSEPPMDFSYTKEFLEFLNQNQILYIYLTAPFPKYFQNGKYLKKFYQEFEAFLKDYPHAKIYYLKNQFLDENLFSDQVHLLCEGAQLINEELQNETLPEIVKFIEKRYVELYSNQNQH
ncbi:MAG: DUF1574 domain-containing protein [Leptospiraceae bacterium]|nr:DUF1574 domain-containing protein [Leptospiraceae bacterium]MDW7975842.1 hypothetical protein [Leptospiraceae bacterium]